MRRTTFSRMTEVPSLTRSECWWELAKVYAGKRNLGNGYFKDVYRSENIYENRQRQKTVEEPLDEDIPIYRDRVTYHLETWEFARNLEAVGNAAPVLTTSALISTTGATSKTA